jgi:hypothetical protein
LHLTTSKSKQFCQASLCFWSRSPWSSTAGIPGGQGQGPTAGDGDIHVLVN